MAANEELKRFVQDGLAAGASRDELAQALRRAGWAAAQVRGAVASFADVEFPIPVPRPRPYLSARDAFLHLLLFSTLYVSAFNLGQLLFQLIDLAFPDPADARFSRAFVDETIRWSIASLVVAFPVFLGVSRRARRELAGDAARRASPVRRWLTWMTIFIASAVLIGTVIGLVYNLLGGELTVRFVLKAATVGGIAGTAFRYYLADVNADDPEGDA